MSGFYNLLLCVCFLLISACETQRVSTNYDRQDLAPVLTKADRTAFDSGSELVRKLIATKAIGDVPNWTNHVIASDKRGKFEERMFDEDADPCRRRVQTGIEEFANCQIGRVLRALDKALRQHAKNPNGKPFRLLLSIHGGLVSEEAATRQAKDHLPLMLAEGVYPIFLNWHTGAFNSYGDQITFVRNGARIDSGNTAGFERVVQIAATPLHAASDVGEGLARAPVQWASQLADLSGEFSGNNAPAKKYKDRFSWNAITKANNVIATPGRLPAAENTMERAHFWITSPFKLATMPFVDGIGRPAWNNMLRRSRAALKTGADFRSEPTDCHFIPGVNRACYWHGSGAFARFLSHLKILMAHHRGRSKTVIDKNYNGYAKCMPIEISLVAHSMGAIISNDILRDFDIGYCNVVYMAAASSIRHFYNTALPYIQRNAGVRFYNLMLHPANDQREDYAWGLAPEGSLLVWIDGFYEESDSVFDRTMGAWKNLGRVKSLFPAEAQRCIIFKVFGIKGRFPTGHGAFNDVLINRIDADGTVEYDYNYWQGKFWGHQNLADREPACR